MTQRDAQLSIIIVNWNTIDMLRDCLASVYAGRGTLLMEVIVVDNASTDGSGNMVESAFPEVILIRNTENLGFAAANNQALEIASGEYILLLNSDTIVHGTVLQRSIDYMIANSGVGAMSCRVLNLDGTLQHTCSQFPTLLNLFLSTSGLSRLRWPAFFDRFQMRAWKRDDERDVDVLSGCYMMIRASALEQVGMLDTDFFFYGEETDWCRRAKALNWHLRFAPVGVITHYGEGSGRKLSYMRDMMLSTAMVRLHRKHGGIVHAVTAWLMLFSFNLSRAVYWTLRSVLSGDELQRERRNHFFSLVSHYHRSWPHEHRPGPLGKGVSQ